MTGVVTVVVRPCKVSGRVLSAPTAWLDRAISSHDKVNPKRTTPAREGAMIGTRTWAKVCQDEAPRSRAASSYELLKRLKMANMISTPNGSVQVRCAPRPDDIRPIAV